MISIKPFVPVPSIVKEVVKSYLTAIKGATIPQFILILPPKYTKYSTMASEACRALPAVVTTDYKPKGTNVQIGSFKTCNEGPSSCGDAD
jgi:hypothetical protein